MKLHYYLKTDSLYIDLRDVVSVETRELANGVNADFDVAGNIVGLDIDGASSKIDLRALELNSLPVASSRIV